jgi:F-type H+-transporting ATPase subunit delta
MIRQRQTTVVARSYAEALFRAARAQGILQRVQEECKALAAVLARLERFVFFLGNPQVPTETKLELIERVFTPRVSPLLSRMLVLMVRRERVDHLAEALDLLEEMVEHAEGLYEAVLASAVDLDFQDKLRLKTELEKYTGCRLRIDYRVDADLIGGLVFRFRDVLIDGSLRFGLGELRRRMLETPLAQSQ